MSPRMFIIQVLASQLHFLTSRNARLAIPPLLWAVNCIKIGERVALLIDPVYSLYCGSIICMLSMPCRLFQISLFFRYICYFFRLEMFNKAIVLDSVFLICKMIKVSVRVISLAFGFADNSYLDSDNSAHHKNLFQ